MECVFFILQLNLQHSKLLDFLRGFPSIGKWKENILKKKSKWQHFQVFGCPALKADSAFKASS